MGHDFLLCLLSSLWNKHTYNFVKYESSVNYFVIGLFVCLFDHPFSHTYNIGQVNYRLQFIYYNITYNIWTSIQYNIIITKFKDQLEVVSVTTNRNICIYIFVPMS